MKGQCLCGGVTLETPDVREFGACHCGMCRRWGGGPLLAVHCGSDVKIGGSVAVSVHRSSDWAQRAFCPKCGTHVYYLLVPANEYFVPLGVLDGTAGLRFAEQIFIDSKPDNYSFANDTALLTEADIVARYAPPA